MKKSITKLLAGFIIISDVCFSSLSIVFRFFISHLSGVAFLTARPSVRGRPVLSQLRDEYIKPLFQFGVTLHAYHSKMTDTNVALDIEPRTYLISLEALCFFSK